MLSRTMCGVAWEAVRFSCWEVAKLVEYGRIELACAIEEWMEQAVAYPGMQLLELTPQIVIESKTPGSFHCDPADRSLSPQHAYMTSCWQRIAASCSVRSVRTLLRSR